MLESPTAPFFNLISIFRCSHPLGDLIFCHSFILIIFIVIYLLWEVIGVFTAKKKKKKMGFNTILKDQLRISALNSKLIHLHS